MTEPIWVIVPFLNSPAMTRQAVLDCLAQSVPTRVLLIGQGASEETLSDLREFAEQHHPRVLLWSFVPALPSLSAVWNRALQFVWELGGTEALVANNDCRIHRQSVEVLQKALHSEQALFVSCVGVREGQYDPAVTYDACAGTTEGWLTSQKGGPDFSCYLISREGHEKYPFDEGFVPAYGEDCDSHRRYMLGGDGARIFSLNIPFLHYASGTIKEFTPEARAKFNRAYDACMAYYTRKWGGKPNYETYYSAFDPDGSRRLLELAAVGPTTPELQEYYRVAKRPTDIQAVSEADHAEG